MTRPLVEAAPERVREESVRQAFRGIRRLVGCCADLSVLTLVALVLLRDRPGVATDAAWVRTVIVAVTSLLMVSFAARAAWGTARCSGPERARVARDLHDLLGHSLTANAGWPLGLVPRQARHFPARDGPG
ncbi:histidine kinase [Streptomyces rimosus]|uniref:histidine kinase n=1 Tax=Streptomyces rimosus TaxID=1927 RepID=UPI00067E45CA|nr:histidine kinase [Streptomyces rimosus]